MKTQTIFLTLLLIVASFSIQAQSKKELEKQLKEANAKNDSILKENEAIKANVANDRTSNMVVLDITKVNGDSTVVVAKQDSTAKAVAAHPDSVKKNPEPVPNATFGMSSTTNSKADQLELLRAENERLNYIVNHYFGKGTIPAQQEGFLGLWALSLQYFKVTEDSTKSGLINVPAPPQSRVATQVIFIDFELAEITFSNGESTKCFYKINSFSAIQPYSIDFTKGPELNVRLQVNPTSGSELQVSYKKGNGYYSGYMRKML